MKELYDSLEFVEKNPSSIYKIIQKIDYINHYYVAERKKDQKKFMIKSVEKRKLESMGGMQGFYNEAVAHFKVESPYMIKFIQAFNYKNTFFIVKEMIMGNILTSAIKAYHGHNRDYSEDFCVYTLYCIAKGLKDMHDKFLVHRDIQPNNIFYDPDGNLKIAGLSQVYFLTQ